MGRKKNELHTVNSYLPEDLYDQLRVVCEENLISMSRLMNMLLEDYITGIDSQFDNEFKRLEFRNKIQCSYMRVPGKKNVGVVLNDEKYNKIRQICDDNNTTVSEVFRVLSKNHIDKLEKQYNLNYRFGSVGNGEFQMFIDLG